jgi:hypothetical protein
LKCTNSQWKTKIEEHAKKFVPMFKFIAKFGSQDSGNGQFNSPFFVATDRQGNIYVIDCDNHRIQVFDSNRQWKQSIGSKGSGNGQFNGPMGIAFNSKNHMFVADCGNHRIVEFDENMQFIKAFGSEGNENDQLQYPHGIAIDADDSIVVVDSNNHRIQIYGKDGNWIQTIGKQESGNDITRLLFYPFMNIVSLKVFIKLLQITTGAMRTIVIVQVSMLFITFVLTVNVFQMMRTWYSITCSRLKEIICIGWNTVTNNQFGELVNNYILMGKFNVVLLVGRNQRA